MPMVIIIQWEWSTVTEMDEVQCGDCLWPGCVELKLSTTNNYLFED
ncbi:hypothetical protein LCGC14_0475720 [marine sediment metagenome]|uniref:Uncharacterized protein n=1 Tax=marine sediment metagenome TaxID=412755 RepID=A0A0F9SAQ6_9ZZZZ